MVCSVLSISSTEDGFVIRSGPGIEGPGAGNDGVVGLGSCGAPGGAGSIDSGLNDGSYGNLGILLGYGDNSLGGTGGGTTGGVIVGLSMEAGLTIGVTDGEGILDRGICGRSSGRFIFNVGDVGNIIDDGVESNPAAIISLSGV